MADIADAEAVHGSPVWSIAEQRGDHVDFRWLLTLFRRRLLLFVTTVALCVTLAILINLNLRPLYSADAEVIINGAPADNSLPKGSEAPDEPVHAEQVETEVQSIESRELAAHVFDAAQLARDPGFREQVEDDGRLNRLIRALTGSTRPALSDASFRELAVATLIGNLKAERMGTALAVSITYTDPDPVRAAKIANIYARQYASGQIATKQAQNRRSIGLVQQRVEELRQQAQTDYGAVQQFRIANGLLSANATSLTEQELSSYNQQVAAARAQAADDAARLAAARRQLLSGFNAVADEQGSGAVSALRTQRAQVSARAAELSGRYLDSHPDLQAARRELADLDVQIAQEVSRTLLSFQARARASAERLASLTSSQATGRGTLAANNRALTELDDLNRRAKASQDLYESYLSRYRELVSQSGAEQANARVISFADLPRKPSFPNKLLNLALGFLIGALLGAAGAVAAESSFGGLTTADDVEKRLGIRCFGGIPLLKSVEKSESDPAAVPRALPGSAFTEACRNALTSLRQSLTGPAKVIGITSALPNEGKTIVAICLARTAALGGQKVLVIDCDPIRRSLTTIVGSNRKQPGLRELLAGKAALGDALIQDQDAERLHILPITGSVPREERLLDHVGLHAMIKALANRYDLILLDCPPVLPIAEAREIAGIVDALVIVARWRRTEDKVLRNVLKLLPPSAASVSGVLLNQVDMRKRGYFGAGDPAAYFQRFKTYYTS